MGSRQDAAHRVEMPRRDVSARDDASARRDAGLAKAEESRREPPEQAEGFWTRARRFFGFSKSAEKQPEAAQENEQATEKRPVGP
jgi:hypothetical protein